MAYLHEALLLHEGTEGWGDTVMIDDNSPCRKWVIYKPSPPFLFYIFLLYLRRHGNGAFLEVVTLINNN